MEWKVVEQLVAENPEVIKLKVEFRKSSDDVEPIHIDFIYFDIKDSVEQVRNYLNLMAAQIRVKFSNVEKVQNFVGLSNFVDDNLVKELKLEPVEPIKSDVIAAEGIRNK